MSTYTINGTFNITSIEPVSSKIEIDSFEPATGTAGTQVTIHGKNLSAVTELKFGDIESDIIPVSNTEIKTTVPQGATTSRIYAVERAASDTIFVVNTPPPVNPSITGYTPNSGKVGSEVLISGTNLTLITTVNFGVAIATFTATSNQIKAIVPNMSDGTYNLICYKDSTPYNVGSFTVTSTPIPPGNPLITSTAPTQGMTGTEVTLKGTNLNAIASIKFGNAPTTFTPVSSTEVKTICPSIIPGSYQILCYNSIGQPFNGGLFQVTNTPPPINPTYSPASGPVGTIFTITAQNLNAVTGIKIRGVACKYTVDSPTKITAIVPDCGGFGYFGLVLFSGSTSTQIGTFNVTESFVTGYSPKYGQVGTTLKITGNTLNTVTSVKIGGIECPFTATSSEITTTVPDIAFGSKPIVLFKVNNIYIGDFNIVTPPSGEKDKFGITKLYSSIGREWFNKWEQGGQRQYTWDYDVLDPECIFRGEGTYIIYGSSGQRPGQMQITGNYPRVYVRSTPSDSVPLPPPPPDKPLWNNVEVTFYAFSTNASPTIWSGYEAVIKCNHCPDSDQPTTRGYGGRMLYDGRIDIEKEVQHSPNTNVRTNPVYPWENNGTMPLNVWIGYKFVGRNIDKNNNRDWHDDTSVQLEVYRDQSLFSQGATMNPTPPQNGGEWELLFTYVDDGNWSTGYGSFNPPTPGTLPEYNPSKAAALTWPNWSVYLRSDDLPAPQYYKWFSVREVAPISS